VYFSATDPSALRMLDGEKSALVVTEPDVSGEGGPAMMWNGDWSWGAWIAMTVGMLVFWGLVAWAVVSVVRPASSSTGAGAVDAEAILAERFAIGAIDPDEYQRRLDLLRRSGRTSAQRPE
jgi:putative membrane protein